MEVLFLLLIVSLMVSGSFLVAFIIHVRKGEFDDTTSPAEKMLFDDK